MNVKPITALHQSPIENHDLVCFCHLRWNFVYQRPQHLFRRFSKVYRTFFIEEAIVTDAPPSIQSHWENEKLCIVTPHVNPGAQNEQEEGLRNLLTNYFEQNAISNYTFWYYTPMALAFTDHFEPQAIVYDCMDELSAFKFAPPRLKELEAKLFSTADVVFTGGHSLYQHKKNYHHNIYPFPSSIDKTHFEKARVVVNEPEDQKNIPHPRIGFYGVVDERFDIQLLDEVAAARPEWQFVILGPVVKIDPAQLPVHPNIHYLGGKTYDELPAYLSGWDIAFIPFARNESTRFISPTKTPEYLAAGKPVISTSIQDVIEPYGNNKLVYIADKADEFIRAAETILNAKDKAAWLNEVDLFLHNNSWDRTWMAMMQLMQMAVQEKLNVNTKKKKEAYV